MNTFSTIYKPLRWSLLALCSMVILMAQIPVDHKLNVKFVKPSNESYDLVPISCMYAGLIEPDFLQMERIYDYEDGEIIFSVMNHTGTIESILVGLTNEDVPSEYFRFRLSNGTLILEENYNGTSRAVPLEAYDNGDEIRVVRCQQTIRYFVNNFMIEAINLVDNDFEMFGEVDVQYTSSQPFEAYVEFHPL